MDLLSLGKTEGVLINAHKYLQDGCQGKCDRLFSVVQSYRTKSNGHKPKQGVAPQHHFIEGGKALEQATLGGNGIFFSPDPFKTQLYETDLLGLNLLVWRLD